MAGLSYLGPMARPIAAVVLPPREGFGPGDAGAVGLLAHRLARHEAAFRTIVLGLSLIHI